MWAMAQRSWEKNLPLERVELPDPVPVRNEVRVRVRAAGVNPVDWKMREQGPLRLAARLVGPPPPVVVGVDFAGTVDAVGPAVTGVRVGDAVVGGTDFSRGQRGSTADTVRVRADQVCVLPPGFDLVTAAALPVAGVTAWTCVVELGRVRGGDRVLVLGASGGVGQLAVQVARLQGALVTSVCSARNAELVRSLGADTVLDYGAGDALEQARAQAPFRAVIDCVGGYSGPRCRALLGPGGRHVLVAGDTPSAWLDLLRAPLTSTTVLGRPTGARLRPLVDAVASGALRVNVVERIPLAEVERAHALSRAGRTAGKIVLVV
ncbi:MAG: NAD(P)-dependent alcohol dehydrogenase [Deltaproteobacteria bacterium]|nr:NAD(P)-dependent alcohol dehydrogenase [Deltaproteobacteria bacterium]